MRLLFDIETDGLLDELQNIWCLCAADLDSDQEWSFGPDEIEDGLALLNTADELWGHNIIEFDLPALEQVNKWTPWGTLDPDKIRDTLTLCKFCFSDQGDKDAEDKRPHVKSLAGKHALKAWGIRLGYHKGDFGEQENAWAKFSKEMLTYCIRDVRLNKRLAKYVAKKLPKRDAVNLEIQTAIYAARANRRGWPFDEEGGKKLAVTLKEKQDELTAELQKLFPGRTEEMSTPQYWEMTVTGTGATYRKDTKGELETFRKSIGIKPKQCKLAPGPMKVKVHEFNPGSTKQVAAKLYERYKWTSPELTDKGVELFKKGHGKFEELILQFPQIKEDTLKTLSFPEAPKLVEWKMLQKRLSMLSTGPGAWLKLCRNGRMYYRLDTLGTITHRATHTRPNLSQVTGVDKPWGEECRALFHASEGYVQIGIDLSGIEARMLAHFLFPYDRGAFADLVLNGDFHQHNADNIGLPRKPTKNVFYGWSYGAGDMKIGKQVVSASDEWKSYYNTQFKKNCRTMPPNKASEQAYRKIGKIIRGRLEQGIKGLPELIGDVQAAAGKRGYLKPLDGRRIPVRSDHSALNTLLQGSAAVAAKRWLCRGWSIVDREKLDSHMLIFSHDEIQSDTRPEHKDRHIEIFLDAIKYTESYYNIKIRLDGEAKVGADWAACH